MRCLFVYSRRRHPDARACRPDPLLVDGTAPAGSDVTVIAWPTPASLDIGVDGDPVNYQVVYQGQADSQGNYSVSVDPATLHDNVARDDGTGTDFEVFAGGTSSNFTGTLPDADHPDAWSTPDNEVAALDDGSVPQTERVDFSTDASGDQTATDQESQRTAQPDDSDTAPQQGPDVEERPVLCG